MIPGGIKYNRNQIIGDIGGYTDETRAKNPDHDFDIGAAMHDHFCWIRTDGICHRYNGEKRGRIDRGRTDQEGDGQHLSNES